MPIGRKPGEAPKQEPKPRRERKSRGRMSLEERRQLSAERAQTRGCIDTADGKVHVAKILTPDPSIFPAKLLRALQHYLDTEPRDIASAAKRGNMALEEFKAYLKTPGVKEYLEQEEAKIDEAVANMRARARILTEDHLDAATVEVLTSASTPAPQKVRMIEVGYRRFGMLKDKAEVTGAGGAPMAFQLIRMQGRKDDDDNTGN